MTLQIKEGGYYRRGDMNIEGPLKRDGDYWRAPHGSRWELDGRYLIIQCCETMDLIAEVEVRDKLPFELQAGAKYNTVKPDGTAGPVVELAPSIWIKAAKPYLPFMVVGRAYETVVFNGEVVHADGCEVLYRITSEYIEPKPPTPLERLEKWRAQYGVPSAAVPDLDAIIADFKAEDK